MSRGSTPNIQTQSLGSMETVHPVHISYEKGTPQDIGSKETVHPVHISYKKGTPQDIEFMETAHPVQCHIHMKKVLLQDIGSMETVHPVHITQNTDIHTKPRKGHATYIYRAAAAGCWLLVSMATYRSSVKPPYLTHLP